MVQTAAGARKAVQTIRERHGADFYSKIGAIGGASPAETPKGFAADRERARLAGRKGGAISRRGSKKNVQL